MADGITIIDQPAGAIPPSASAVLTRVRNFAAQPAVQRSLPLLGLVVAAIAAAVMWSAMTAAPQRELFPGLADVDKAAVAQALDAASVSYKVDSGTGALRVSGDDYHKARMMLAAQGLPKSAPASIDASASIPLGASEAVERERLLGAREADLAHTIEAIDAVQAARVHLAVEAPSLFVRERKEPRASIMVTLRSGRTLSEGQVAAITHLVSASVSGLSADGVAVIDQSGRLLSNPDGDALGSSRQFDIQQRMETRYRDALATLLTPMVGANGFSAEVHADLDFAQTDSTRESFPESGRALRAEDQKWTSDGSGNGNGNPPAVGVPGALSNVPPPASTLSAQPTATPTPAAGAAAPAPGMTSQDVSRRFELGREVQVVRGSPGALKRLSLAVVLREMPGKKRSPAEIQSIEQLVRGAIGFDQARGDVVTVSSKPFVSEVDSKPAWYEAAWIPMVAKYAGAMLALALGWLFVGRPLLRRYNATTDSYRRARIGALLGQELGTDKAASSKSNAAPVTLEMIEAAPGYTARASLVRDFVRQDPERAALVLRDMIRSQAAETVGE